MRYAALTLAAAALMGFSASPAHANAIAASTILQDFNTVIFGNASTQADIEGAAVIGGNFSGATMYNNPNDGGTVTLPSGYNALTVYGSTSGNSININNGGSAYVAGNHGAPTNFNGGGGFSYTAPPSTISDFQTSLNNLSTQLSQLTANSSLVMPTDGSTNGVKFNATPGANGVAVFNITASQLSSFASYVMNLNGSSSIIVNVSGTNVTLNGNDNSGVAGANNIIWNFYQAQTLNLGTLLGGTVLATQAAVTNNNQIDGGLFAQSWTGQGELHSYSFTGTLPSSGTTVVATPEPASIGLLGAGLAALGLVRRRRATRIDQPV